MPLGTQVCLGLRNIVLDRDPAPSLLKRHSPSSQFSANVRCGQTSGWTKMPLGMEVGLGTGDFMFDRELETQLYPSEKRHTQLHPIFGPCLLWPNCWMDEDAT